MLCVTIVVVVHGGYCASGSRAWRILCYMVGGAQTAYPIPRIDDTLDTLSGSCWFSTLDMVSGYWQVEVGEQDREKTLSVPPMDCMNLMSCLLVYAMGLLLFRG